jgi:hypothetical protein
MSHLVEIHNGKQKTKQAQLSVKTMQKRLGYLYFKHLCEEFDKPLRSIGGTMYSFYSNLNSLHESLINHAQFGPRFLYLHESYTGYTPSFRCEHIAAHQFNIFTIQENTTTFINNFYFGLIESSASLIWNLNVRAEKIRLTKSLDMDDQIDSINNSPYILGYRVTLFPQTSQSSDAATNSAHHPSFLVSGNDLSNKPDDLCISVDILKSTFPFTLILDRSLNIKQMGDSFVKYLGQLVKANGLSFLTYFEIVQPKLNEYTFETLLLNHNMSYRLKMRPIADSSQFKDMELKGSLVYLHESDCLMFIGSPVIQRLEELTGRGLYISDIPIHDATRDIILVGEQTKAQV